MEIELLTTRLRGKVKTTYILEGKTIIQGTQLIEMQPIEEVESDILYIGDIMWLRQLSKADCKFNYLCACTSEERNAWHEKDVIGNVLFWESIDAHMAFVAVQSELLSFQRFRTAITQPAREKTSKTILAATGNYMKRPVFYFCQGRDRLSRTICSSADENLPEELQLELKNANDPSGEYVHNQKRYVFFRVKSGKTALGTLAILCDTEEPVSPLITVLGMTADALILNNVHNTIYYDINAFSRLAENLVMGKPYSEQEKNCALRLVGWKEDDFYFLYKFVSGHTEKTLYEFQAIGDEIRTLPINCRYFFSNEALYLIINRSQSKMIRIRQIRQLMIPILNKHDLYVGICNGMIGFSNLSHIAFQCDVAIEFGRKIHPGLRYYQHAKYLLYHVISCCSEERNLNDFIHPAIRILQEQDRKFGTEYVKTLTSYVVNDRVIAKTADDLHIHRNTMNYRLDKIKSLTQVEFETEEETLYVMISCYIIEYLSHKKIENNGNKK